MSQLFWFSHQLNSYWKTMTEQRNNKGQNVGRRWDRLALQEQRDDEMEQVVWSMSAKETLMSRVTKKLTSRTSLMDVGCLQLSDPEGRPLPTAYFVAGAVSITSMWPTLQKNLWTPWDVWVSPVDYPPWVLSHILARTHKHCSSPLRGYNWNLCASLSWPCSMHCFHPLIVIGIPER